jgi:hypothetical protein
MVRAGKLQGDQRQNGTATGKERGSLGRIEANLSLNQYLSNRNKNKHDNQNTESRSNQAGDHGTEPLRPGYE